MSAGERRPLANRALVVGVGLGLVGAIAPWIPHRAAGLSLGAFYLFESLKFFPAVASGAVPLLREAFLLPLLVSGLLISLLPVLTGARSILYRLICLGAAVAIALLALPMYPAILTAHQNPEFRGQLLLAIGTLLLVILSPLASRLSRRLVMLLAAVMAAVALILPVIQFVRVQPLYSELYGAPVGVGWGLFVCVLGLGLVCMTGILTFFLRLRPSSAV